MAVSDWISRLFSSGNAKGLSGEGESLEPDAPWFGGRLRRHQSPGDLVNDPALMWSGGSGGLQAHLTERTQDASADFTDILIVVNSSDWGRSLERLQEPWADTAARALDNCFDQMSKDKTFPLLFANRGLCFHILCDGGPEMAGEDYDLQPGEFVTGLLPNQYTTPVPSSRPMVAIHLNLPEVWEGYREVGRLYSDQVSFTLGNHWLDSFSHFALQEPGLYRLQQYLDGNFVHIIDPDLQSRYSVVNNEDAGANVLSIMDQKGEIIAHLVLALMDSVVPDEPAQPGIQLPTPVEAESTPSYHPSFTGSLDGVGHKTIVPESVQERIFTLKERGALLQKVHFHKFMRGYDVYVSGNGSLTTRTLNRAATFQVRANQVSLVVHKPEVLVDGSPASLETPRPLNGTVNLQVGPHHLQYNDLTPSAGEPGWPYLGEILRPASSNHMIFGASYGIGRDRRNKVQLPDEPHNDNIAWLDGQGGSGVIRARSGEIRKSQFYTDSIMVASKHAEVDLAGEPTLTNIAKHCYSYVRRAGRVYPLVPTKQQGDRSITLQTGDDVLVGNCFFTVSYGVDSPSLSPSAPPPPKLTAASLAKAADGDTWADSMEESSMNREARRSTRTGKPPASLIDEILNARGARDTRPPDGPAKPSTPSLDALLNARKTPEPGDMPAAAGLGEHGLPPKLPEITSHGYDSLMGLDPSEPSVLEVEGQELAKAQPLRTPRPPAELPERDDLTDEGGLLFGLPGPNAPRQDFDVMGDVAGTPERMVSLTSERDGPEHSASEPGLVEDLLDDPATELPGASILAPPNVKSLPARGQPPVRPNPASLPYEPSSLEDYAPTTFEQPATPPKPKAKPQSHPAPKPATGPSVPAPHPAAKDPTHEPTFIPQPGGVAVVDEDAVQVQLARPARLTQIGWALAGPATVGNHHGCQVVIPENQVDDEQTFSEHTYCELRVRGHRGKCSLASEREARLFLDGQAVSQAKGLDNVRLEIIRRDEDGDEDFAVSLALDPAAELPDPRGRLLAIDLSDRIVASLFVQGLPLGTQHRVRLGPITATLHFDGSGATLMEYLPSYRSESGFAPFFHKGAGQSSFSTVPEDGRDLRMQPGDELIAGLQVFRFSMR